MTKPPEVILLHETATQSWLRDASSVAMFVALIGIGVYLESSAMQWVGALVGFLAIIGKVARVGKDNRYTIPKARARLDEIERQSAANTGH
jgi:hypothetical protein